MKTALLLFCLGHLGSTIAQSPRSAATWSTAPPEAMGLSSAGLNELFSYVREHQTRVHSIQVLRQGKLLLDAYFYPYSGHERHDVASVTKSITSTLAGIAIDKGNIKDINSPVYTYFPEYPVTDSLWKTVTLKDLLTMRSGLDCGATMADPGINYDRRLEQVRQCPDWIKCILNIPMAGEPGEKFSYCNPNCHLVTAIIRKTSGLSAFNFADKYLFRPLNIRNAYWPADPAGINHGWGDLQLHPYDMLRIGQLMLQKGKWKNDQLISESWLQEATVSHVTATGNSDEYGYYWWLPGPSYPGVFEAVGRGGQRITIWPSRQMVIVFTGGGFNTSDLVPFIIKAIRSDHAIPADPQAFRQLQANIHRAAQAPSVSPPTNAEVALPVSGKTYKLPANSLAWDSLRFTFQNPREATMHLQWAGRKMTCPIGLNGQMRFSVNPITRLRQGCTAVWATPQTLHLQLDLIGAINLYTVDVTFSQDVATAEITLREGTGLNNEKMTGRAVQ